ncbi:MAG TPA: GNAT family N-acetyltransferase [Xanthobacteraceae bacterium]|nr:GNAT family N-acetyltransferase [Xanthobacteraceae bacterium]
MARAHPSLALRPFLPADAPLLAEIFRASVEELTADDYSEAQQQAWAAIAEDEEAFGARLADRLTLIATLDGSPVGFVSLEGPEHLDMLYVHPAVAGQGVGTMLCDALEKIAAGRGTPRLSVEASDSARDFFGRRGYVPQRRNTVSCRGEWLASTTMEKALTKGSGP